MDLTASRRLERLAQHLSSPVSLQEATVARQATAALQPQRFLEGQVAIITGSGQGVGAAAARLFAAHGAKVVVTDIDAAKSAAVAQEVVQAGGQAISVPGDVTAEDFPARIVSEAVSKFGSLDVLVNNAGYTWDGVIHKMTPRQWAAMLDVHCTAPFRLIQAASPHMRDAAKAEMEAGHTPRPRCIINVSSTSGTHGNAGQANYGTAKAGIIGLTKSVAKEWGPFNIRCNALAYGHILTRLVGAKEGGGTMQVGGETVRLGIPSAQLKQQEAFKKFAVPLGRSGTPEEAAGAMLMLASPYASYITAQVIEVTGGAFA